MVALVDELINNLEDLADDVISDSMYRFSVGSQPLAGRMEGQRGGPAFNLDPADTYHQPPLPRGSGSFPLDPESSGSREPGVGGGFQGMAESMGDRRLLGAERDLDRHHRDDRLTDDRLVDDHDMDDRLDAGGRESRLPLPGHKRRANERAADEDRDDDEAVQLRRKRVSDMSPEERLKWSRIQSRDHSRRSRQRRKQLEQDLRTEIEQLQSFRTLIEDSYQLVSIQSIDHAATFLYANSVFFRALNYVPQELIGVSIMDLAHPDDRTNLEQSLNKLLLDDSSKPYVTVDWRIRSRKSPPPGMPDSPYMPLSSSASINQQGLVMFSMLKGEPAVSSQSQDQAPLPSSVASSAHHDQRSHGLDPLDGRHGSSSLEALSSVAANSFAARSV
mmetsp:Transcript_25805/g.57853  ORF Transcript_25805/g.57853 Transcript_25805/m.57853 type:complete len:389 (-) Transcript_25805:209-1375(-)|eukprot:CAMPEP_0172631250 /NCGR_PEP_ID=MMETSP1068-20121228/178126_1 /TAXON_ID=35684 /ORGANISM="Pseudopedinella elastica, Strain CCMP716" /LENGTH=388 /DNA_ID=CAMNT_0013442329 /DNA_START=208 /DNA_END=1374 /DNA_ORIENTATION=-